jgi:hypothetical protein
MNMVSESSLDSSLDGYEVGSEVYFREAIPGVFAAASSIFVFRITADLYHPVGSLFVSGVILLPFIITGFVVLNAHKATRFNGKFWLIIIFEALAIITFFDKAFYDLVSFFYQIFI